MLHQKLWRLNQDIAQQCLEHRFVQDLANGTLHRDAFRRYVAQDAFFLRAFMRAYALAAAKSAEWRQSQLFHELMGGILEELELHERYATELDIDLQSVSPVPATCAYTDFLLRVAWQDSVAETIAAMTPCMRLYGFLGAQLAAQTHASTYSDWIRTYASDDFQDLCAKLESLLDKVAKDTAAIRDTYRYAMQCELKFFAAPLEGET